MIGEHIVDRSDFLPRRPKGFLDFPTMDRAFLALCYKMNKMVHKGEKRVNQGRDRR